MHAFIPAFSTLVRHAGRLREPLVQVWLMAGMSMILIIMGHVHAVRQSGGVKNQSSTSAMRLLTAGASMRWTDEFAPVTGVQSRPSINLSQPAAPDKRIRDEKTLFLDWRGEMNAAANRPWKFLGNNERRAIDSADRPANGAAVHLAWSGDSRGNADLLVRESQRRGLDDSTTFVIGNGSRSGDGGIALPAAIGTSSDLKITLIGSSHSVTENQKAALGELLNYLEARYGQVICEE